MKPEQAGRILLGIRAEEFRQELEALQAKHGLRIQMGWHGKHAYLQAVPIEGGDEAVTVAKVTKGGRMRWRFDDEQERAFRWERVHCGECGAIVPEAKR